MRMSGFDIVAAEVSAQEQRLAERAKTSPKAAIRLFCITCMGGSKHDVKGCASLSCPLHPFRLGRVPNGRVMTDEQRAAAVARLALARQNADSGG